MEAKRIQAAIKTAVMVVFLGYVFIWVILPTNLYKKHWLPKIRAHTMSTYFGTQGFYIMSFLYFDQSTYNIDVLPPFFFISI